MVVLLYVAVVDFISPNSVTPTLSVFELKDTPDAATKFKEAQEAYAVLSDKEKRAQYDQFGHQAFNGNAGYGNAGFDFSGFDFSDIFDDLFGSSFGFSNRKTSSRRGRRGNDISLSMKITFDEAVYGCIFCTHYQVSTLYYTISFCYCPSCKYCTLFSWPC